MMKALVLLLSGGIIALCSFWLGQRSQNEYIETILATQSASVDLVRLAVHYDVLKKNQEEGPAVAIDALQQWLASDIEVVGIYLDQLPNEQREKAKRLIEVAAPYQRNGETSNNAVQSTFNDSRR